MATKSGLPRDYNIVTKFDPAYGPFATVQVLMKGETEIATIRNGKVVESNDPKLAVGSSIDDAMSYIKAIPAPKEEKQVLPPANTEDLTKPLEDAKSEAGRALTIANSFDKGSKQYKAAVKDYNAAVAKRDAIQKQYDESKGYQTSEGTKNIAAEAATKASQAKDTVTKAQKALDDAKARAKDFPGAAAQQLITDKQTALDQAKAASVAAANEAATKKAAIVSPTPTPTPTPSGTTKDGKPPVVVSPTVIPAGSTVQKNGNVVNADGETIGTSKDGKTLIPLVMPKIDTKKNSAGTPAVTPSSKTANPLPTADQAHAKAEAALSSMGNMGTYSIQMGLINSDPSLKDVFYNDVYLPILQGKQPVDVNKFKADIINSKWWNSYSGPARIAQAAKEGDPATWAESFASTQKLVQTEALNAGYDLSADQVSTLANYALNKSGGKAEAIGGLVLTELKNQITTVGKINSSGGLAATGIAGLKSTAGDYGVAHLFNDQWYTDQQDRIQKGLTTQGAVDAQIKAQAKSSYSALTPQLDAGLTTKAIMQPYATLYGTTLELDPATASLDDTKFSNNLFIQDPKDPSKQILKPLWQYQQDLKKDPRWGYTQNAKQSLDSVAHSFLQSIGVAY